MALFDRPHDNTFQVYKGTYGDYYKFIYAEFKRGQCEFRGNIYPDNTVGYITRWKDNRPPHFTLERDFVHSYWHLPALVEACNKPVDFEELRTWCIHYCDKTKDKHYRCELSYNVNPAPFLASAFVPQDY